MFYIFKQRIEHKKEKKRKKNNNKKGAWNLQNIIYIGYRKYICIYTYYYYINKSI